MLITCSKSWNVINKLFLYQDISVHVTFSKRPFTAPCQIDIWYCSCLVVLHASAQGNALPLQQVSGFNRNCLCWWCTVVFVIYIIHTYKPVYVKTYLKSMSRIIVSIFAVSVSETETSNNLCPSRFLQVWPDFYFLQIANLDIYLVSHYMCSDFLNCV